jgi:hypothetical protein
MQSIEVDIMIAGVLATISIAACMAYAYRWVSRRQRELMTDLLGDSIV